MRLRIFVALDHFGYWWRSQNSFSGRLLHGTLKGRSARLFWGLSSHKAHQLNEIDSSGKRYMAQMGFGKTNRAGSA